MCAHRQLSINVSTRDVCCRGGEQLQVGMRMHKVRVQVKEKKREKRGRACPRSLLIYTLSSFVQHSISYSHFFLCFMHLFLRALRFYPVLHYLWRESWGCRSCGVCDSQEERKTHILSHFLAVVDLYGTYGSKQAPFALKEKK